MKMMKMTLLVLMILVVPIISEDLQLIPLYNPILPVELGKARIVYTKHTFLYYIELLPIIQQLKNLELSFINVKKHLNNTIITNPMSYHGLAQNHLARTEYLLKNTKEKINNLYPINRNKRGLINIVGKAQKWLFGTLDANDGQYYDQAINELQNKQKIIIKTVNQQISLSKSKIDINNRTINILVENQNKLEKSLNILQNFNKKEIDEINAYLIFQGTLDQINTDFQNLITFIDNIENAVMFAKLNTLHSSIASSSDLIEIINDAINLYGQNQVVNFKNIIDLYQFIGTQVIVHKSKLIFAIHLPIVKSQSYLFYHIYPIIQNSRIIIPRYPYLAQKEEEIQFEESPCPSLEDVFYCPEVIHSPDICISNLIKNLNESMDCHIFQIQVKESLVEQITQNNILIMPFKKEQIFSKCKINQYLNIEIPTLIKIANNCTLEIKNRKFINDVNKHYGKPIVLPLLSLNNITKATIFKTQNLKTINLEEIHQLKEMANNIHPIESETSKLEIYHPIVTGILVVLILIGIISLLILNKKLIIRKLYWKNKNGSKPPKEDSSKISSSIFST